MKKLISLLLCLVMILGVMTACGSSDKSSAEGGSKTGIVGTWKANMKLAEYGDMGDMGGMEEYIDVDKLAITVTMKFTADGEYKLAVDDSSIEKLVDVMCDGLEDYMKDMNESGEYTFEDGVLTLDGDEVDFELKGNTLTLEVEGMDVKFTRK